MNISKAFGALDKNHKKAVQAASFVVLGYGTSQVIRLAGNLVLTRLLVPEFFGIMAICNVFIQGIHLFSDFGIVPGVIRSPRSKDPDFLNTAWTLQAVRGFVLFIVAALIAIPVSKIYEERSLAYLLPVLGFASFVQGFQSTSLITLNEELKQGKITYIELVIQVVGLMATIGLAYLYRNIWSLVLGTVISMGMKTIWSHFIHGTRNRWHLEKAAVTEIVSFGKWIFISTAMKFLATQADRIILGKIFALSFFGVYNIAVMFADLPKQVLYHLSQKVLFPLITKYSELPRGEMKEYLRKQRRIIVYPMALFVGAFSCFGDLLISTLYDQRYQDAAWIIPLLALGIWPILLHSSISSVLLTVNRPNFSAYGNLSKFLYMVVFLPLAYHFFGTVGAILVVVLNDIPMYFVINLGLTKERLSLLKQDALATLTLVFTTGCLIALRYFTGLGIPGQKEFLLFLAQ